MKPTGAVEVSLTRGYVAWVDAEDLAEVSRYRWHVVVNKPSGMFYAAANRPRPNKGTILLHRFLMGEPEGLLVDHRDRNGLNNCRGNLRISTRTGNAGNTVRHRDGGSRFKGVYFYKATGRWRAHVRGTHLGYFAEETEAAKAYDVAARRHFGAYARVNFPEEGEQQA